MAKQWQASVPADHEGKDDRDRLESIGDCMRSVFGADRELADMPDDLAELMKRLDD